MSKKKADNLTTGELAERWKMHPDTLRRWRVENKGPSYIKIEKKVMYRIEDVIKYEQKNLVRF